MILTKQDFKIGQEVACRYSGNMARYNEGYKKGVVSKIGRKYITVKIGTFSELQFIIDEKRENDYLYQKTNYSGDYELFPSVKACKEYEEKQKLLREFTSLFDCMSTRKNSLSLQTLRSIKELLNGQAFPLLVSSGNIGISKLKVKGLIPMKKHRKTIIAIASVIWLGSSTISFLRGGYSANQMKQQEHIQKVKSEVAGVMMTKEEYEKQKEDEEK